MILGKRSCLSRPVCKGSWQNVNDTLTEAKLQARETEEQRRLASPHHQQEQQTPRPNVSTDLRLHAGQWCSSRHTVLMTHLHPVSIQL